MLKLFGKFTSQLIKSVPPLKIQNCGIQQTNSFSTWKHLVPNAITHPTNLLPTNLFHNSFARPLLSIDNQNINSTRSVTKFSLKTGKKNAVGAVLNRFFRLDSGLWIRRRAGCHKHIHKKRMQERYDIQQHVFCNQSQCLMLDKMVTDNCKKKKYFIDDPFEPYQVRHNCDFLKPYKRR